MRILYLVFILIAKFAVGQQSHFSVGVNKGKKLSFLVEKPTSLEYSSPGRLLFVKQQASNRIDKPNEKVQHVEGIKIVNAAAVPEIVKEVLGQRLNHLSNRKVIIVKMYPNFKGQIEYVDYVLDIHTDLTKDDLEIITERIQQEVHVYIPSETDRRYRISPIVYNITPLIYK